jgi:predicted acyl esterase
MSENREHWDAYWESKRVDFSKIKIPSYVLASYSSMLHTVGSVRAFKEIECDQKWLRFHPHQEWYEDYLHSSVDDLDQFFERFLKGKSNGWEATPKVRVSMYRYGENVCITFKSPPDILWYSRLLFSLLTGNFRSSTRCTIKSKKIIQSLEPSTLNYT